MFGEKPVRQSVTPISSAMDKKRFLKTSKSIGLIFITGSGARHSALALDDHVSIAVDLKLKLRRHHDGRIGSRDDGGTIGRRSGPQRIPSVERDLRRSPAEP